LPDAQITIIMIMVMMMVMVMVMVMMMVVDMGEKTSRKRGRDGDLVGRRL